MEWFVVHFSGETHVWIINIMHDTGLKRDHYAWNLNIIHKKRLETRTLCMKQAWKIKIMHETCFKNVNIRHATLTSCIKRLETRTLCMVHACYINIVHETCIDIMHAWTMHEHEHLQEQNINIMPEPCIKHEHYVWNLTRTKHLHYAWNMLETWTLLNMNIMHETLTSCIKKA